MKSILKSTGAVAAGFVAIFILTALTDMGLDLTGLKKFALSENAVWFIILIIMYHTVYNVIGCYLAARLSPFRPMRHAMILGTLWLIFVTIGAIITWQELPHWYSITLVILTLPSAWAGGKLAGRKMFLKYSGTNN